MPAGKIECIDEDYVPVECSDTSSSEEEDKYALPEINSLEDLLMEMKDKGGIKLENCNEIEMIRWAIWEAIKQEECKEACLVLFNTILNLANMFLISYNNQKTTTDKLGMS